jgi:hypothetical protein
VVSEVLSHSVFAEAPWTANKNAVADHTNCSSSLAASRRRNLF